MGISYIFQQKHNNSENRKISQMFDCHICFYTQSTGYVVLVEV